MARCDTRSCDVPCVDRARRRCTHSIFHTAHLAATGRYAGIVCVGVVIRGETPHFEHVAREAAAGIRHVALTTGVPATYGVITALTEEQAWDRAGGKVGNRGEEAAAAALEKRSAYGSSARRRSMLAPGKTCVSALTLVLCRLGRAVTVAFDLVLVLVLGPLALSVWLDARWFAAQGLAAVFALRLQTQLLLGLTATLIAAALMALHSGWAALRLRRVALRSSPSRTPISPKISPAL